MEGAPHTDADAGWSQEALNRMGNNVVRVRSADGLYSRLTDPSAIDSQPQGRQVWVLSDSNGNVKDIKYGPNILPTEKAGLRSRIEAEYSKLPSRNQS